MVKVKAKKNGKVFFGRARFEFKAGDEFEIPDDFVKKLKHPTISKFIKVASELSLEDRVAQLESKIKKLEERIKKVKGI